MEPRKLTKEDIDKVRNIEGFPIGTDEDIIALSNAPYYTACPNPFVEEFVCQNGTPYDETTDDYHCEPFAADVSEGKMGDAFYNAHSYHTKVPYKAIMRYILHYTKPGDIVLDGFSGSGMTGVAAQMCGTPESAHKLVINTSMKNVKWGARRAILNDLSPMATFLSNAYSSSCNPIEFENIAKSVIAECEKECAWMVKTIHSAEGSLLGTCMGTINYTIWSDVYICPNCGEEIIYWNVEQNRKKDKSESKCYHCGVELGNHFERAKDAIFDSRLNEVHYFQKEVPVLINYTFGRKKYNKELDAHDYEVIDRINQMDIPYWYPTDLMMGKGEKWGDSWRAGYHQGFTRVHHFYTKRNLYILSKWMDICNKCENHRIADKLKMAFTGVAMGESKLNRYLFKDTSFPFYLLSGTLYVGGLRQENNPLKDLKNKALLRILKIQHSDWKENICISTNSSTKICAEDNSIDYIFTDPPFGDNLMYSELSFIWEAWLKIKTDNKAEAIMNNSQGKGLVEYQGLMTQCFMEYYRVLKPNRWITVEFHNSKNSVWNAIQEALLRAGFIIADVRTLDKQQGSFKQINNASAVKQDLIISAYKPKNSLRRNFESKAGTEETAWDFVRQHLENIPVVVLKSNQIEIITERQAFLLFDRMVAYHIIHGMPVPLDATDFYRGLDEKFLKRDGMYFLADQVNEYDTARIVTDVEPIQYSFIVSNEKTAIAWLYQQLDIPRTYANLQPQFMQEVKSIDKFEVMPELSVLLEENFLQDEKGKWYVPDVTKEGDVAKLREKKLFKEFQGYLVSKGKLRRFRSEAIRVGFSRLWKDKNYRAIVDLAERLPETIIQEDSNLLMYYDISLSRV